MSSSLFPRGQVVPLAAAGVVKLGDNVMPAAAAAAVVANNIMMLAVATPLAVAAAAAVVAKRATNRVRPRHCRRRRCCLRLLSHKGMRLRRPRLAVSGLSSVNKLR